MLWDNKPVLVTGGASFIGSHLVDGLIERGATVRAGRDLVALVQSDGEPALLATETTGTGQRPGADDLPGLPGDHSCG